MRSAEPSPEALPAEVGFNGVYQVGRWTPIRVQVPGATAVKEAVVSVVDVDGRPVTYPLRNAEGGWFAGHFCNSRLDAAVRITVTLADGAIRERVFTGGVESDLVSLRQETRLWMLVGRHVGFERAAEQLNAAVPPNSRGPAVVLLPTSLAAIPVDPLSFDGVDLLVLGPEAISPAQSQSIRRWVERGGRLILSVGSQSSAVRQSDLASWLPISVGDAYIERQTAALTGRVTAYVPNQGILRSLDELQLSHLGRDAGVTIIDGPTAPAVVRSAYGLGLVTVVALDLNAAPFVLEPSRASGDRELVWGGLPKTCQQLAGVETGTAEAVAAERQLQLTPTGVSDLFSQLAGILDHHSHVTRASNWNVIGLLGVYLLVVGPLDYLLVHKLLRRPQLTWVTLPTWVLLASWWATSLATADNGVTASTRQIDVLDVAADTGVLRATGWLSHYSPETRRHEVAYGPQPGNMDAAASVAVRLAPLARPEDGFRGMYRRGGINLGGAAYRIDAGDQVAVSQQTPVEQWSTLALTGVAEWSQPAGEPPLAECRQVSDDRGNALRFDLTHRLPGDVTDWFAVERLQATFPLPTHPEMRSLAPGVTHDLLPGCGQKLLRAYLQGELVTEKKVKTGSDFYIRSDAYDPLGLDPNRLFRVLTFHDAIGGASFSHLANHTLARHDFSACIHLQRLVLCGKLTLPASSFTVDGAPVAPQQRDTFIRLVVPILREVVPAAP